MKQKLENFSKHIIGIQNEESISTLLYLIETHYLPMYEYLLSQTRSDMLYRFLTEVTPKLSSEERKHSADLLHTLAFFTGTYAPQLMLPDHKDIESSRKKLKAVQTTKIFNFEPYFEEEQFIAAFKIQADKMGLNIEKFNTSQCKSFLYRMNKGDDINTGKEVFYIDKNGYKWPCAYEIYMPEGEIKAEKVVMDVYGGSNEKHYDNLAERSFYGTNAHPYYTGKGICYIKFYTPEYKVLGPKHQSEMTQAEMDIITASVDNFKQQLVEICPELNGKEVSLKGGSAGAYTVSQVAENYPNSFKKYIASIGDFTNHSFPHIKLVNCSRLKDKLHIIGNALDNNVLPYYNAIPFLNANNSNISYSLYKKWKTAHSGNFVWQNGHPTVPLDITNGGHNTPDEGIEDITNFILEEKVPDLNLSRAQAQYAVLETMRNEYTSSLTSKLFQLYKNNPTISWSNSYSNLCKIFYKLTSLLTNKIEMSGFVTSIQDMLTDEMLQVAARTYCRKYTVYNALLYNTEFPTDEETEAVAQELATPGSMFFQAFKSYFESLSHIDTRVNLEGLRERYQHLYSPQHIYFVLECIIEQYPKLVQLSGTEKKDFINYERSAKHEFKKAIEDYKNSLNAYALSVFCKKNPGFTVHHEMHTSPIASLSIMLSYKRGLDKKVEEYVNSAMQDIPREII